MPAIREVLKQATRSHGVVGYGMRLLVLAGGFGTRLRAAVADVPKALAPVAGVPFLQLQMDHWVSEGVREFTFLLHHQADQIIAFLQEWQGSDLNRCQIDWVIEPKPMETGGAIANAVRELDLRGEFLIANSDTWLGGGMKELMLAAVPAMAVVRLADTSRYGQVDFDQGGSIVAFSEKNARRSLGWINAGLYYLDADLFENWDGQPFSLERDMFPMLVERGSLRVVPLEVDFIDIGIPEDYMRFCHWVESGRQVSL